MLASRAIFPAIRVLVGRRSLCSAAHIGRIGWCAPVAQSLSSASIAPRFIYHLATFRSPSSTIMRVRRYSGATPEPTEDPDRKGLYYHPVGDNIFALSFLPEAPPHRDSATVIGLIPSDKGLDSFRENRELDFQSTLNTVTARC